MVTIPAGRFTMGVPPGEEEAEGVPAEFRGRSVPQTRIAFARPFALGKNPTTRSEFAARAGTTGPRYWAGGREAACSHSNVRDYSFAGHDNFQRDSMYFACADGFHHTSSVGSFPANPFGLNDMLGNVWQWTADCWNPNLQGQPDNRAARTAGDCSLRVSRGGSWESDTWDLRAGSRNGEPAGDRLTTAGFRVFRTQ